MTTNKWDKRFMQLTETVATWSSCYQQNRHVGAVIVKDGKVIAKAHNLIEKNQDATAHAELLAIKKASKKLKSWRLDGCSIFVTLEPCPMCAGALVNSRIDRVVFGAYDMQAGCCGSVVNFNAYPFNHTFDVTGGILERECREMLTEFFKKKRRGCLI